MAHLAARRVGDVTCSDIPAICGENAFSSERSVLMKKLYKLPSVDTEATLHGKKYEPVAIDEFCAQTGAVVSYPGYLLSPKYPWLGGTVDGIARMTRDITLNGIFIPAGTVLVIEVKCPKSRQIKPDEVPGQYVGQLQGYMEILDFELCIFIQYKPPGPRSKAKFSMLAVPRDRYYMAVRLPHLKKFWDSLNIHGAYLNVVVTVIQRAWRLYLARRAFDRAAKARMRLSVKCANTVGKMAGFMKRREIDSVRQTAFAFSDMESGDPPSTVWVDCSMSNYGALSAYARKPPEARLPVHTGECFVSIKQ